MKDARAGQGGVAYTLRTKISGAGCWLLRCCRHARGFPSLHPYPPPSPAPIPFLIFLFANLQSLPHPLSLFFNFNSPPPPSPPSLRLCHPQFDPSPTSLFVFATFQPISFIFATFHPPPPFVFATPAPSPPPPRIPSSLRISHLSTPLPPLSFIFGSFQPLPHLISSFLPPSNPPQPFSFFGGDLWIPPPPHLFVFATFQHPHPTPSLRFCPLSIPTPPDLFVFAPFQSVLHQIASSFPHFNPTLSHRFQAPFNPYSTRSLRLFHISTLPYLIVFKPLSIRTLPDRFVFSTFQPYPISSFLPHFNPSLTQSLRFCTLSIPTPPYLFVFATF